MSFVDFARSIVAGIASDSAPAGRAAPPGGQVNFAEPWGRVSTDRTSGGASHASAADLELHRRAMCMVNQRGLTYVDALQACHVVDVRFAEAESKSTALVDAARVILRVGTRTSDDGQSVAFSRSDLMATAAAYNPSQREAPLTLGKPAHDAPAFGWVRGLEVTAAGELVMTVSDVHPEFASLVNDRRFTERAVVFYNPRHPSNPSPGVWYLRNISYLGAKKSIHVPGLKHA